MELGAKELELVLAVVRGGTLAEAGRRLGLDTSSVYRAVKRLERALGEPLFDRSRRGMAPSELAQALAADAEAVEAALLTARERVLGARAALTGTLRITSNDVMLAGLLMPLLPAFRAAHPQLGLELLASNLLARLDRREADVALRGTPRPPEHLVGVRLGTIRSALWASRDYLAQQAPGTDPAAMDWAVPDADPALAVYPSRRWRERRYPAVEPRIRCDGMLSVVHAVRSGLAIGVAPYFLMAGQDGLVDLSGPLPEVEVDCWLLTHPDMRHLRRVKAFFDHVRRGLVLP
ncbi:MAG: LysR family transcriptional regulator [Burkholderiaceae bacterium]|nr:LysR family transcriptional regulator [Burkholderiaceae bacterium]